MSKKIRIAVVSIVVTVIPLVSTAAHAMPRLRG
jgi:hypothetical protein